MRTPRLYWPAPLPTGTVPLPDTAARHLLKVLRRRDGDPVELFDGAGSVAQATLCNVSPKGGQVIVADAREDRRSETPLHLHLGLPLLRGERMDVALQKACELGVSEITLLQTRRTEVKFEAGARGDRRLAHAEGVLVHAAQQSGRTVLPQLHAPQPLEHFAAERSETLKVVLDPEGAPLETFANPNPRSVALITGPEGGLSEEECETLARMGFVRWRLGPRILRAETAPLAAVATLSARFGDF
ncbi:MAG: 16S rRNA (uracil(1498)-N(3))-methyltransferase [Pseudomonadales bacterium]